MERREFIGKGLAGMAALAAATPLLAADGEPYPASAVEAFVKAGHKDLDKVKELNLEYPGIVNCAHDWGEGDYETALGGASHVGAKEIARYLIQQGARADVFAFAMLGEVALVKAIVEAYPASVYSLGPHGYTLLHHATVGGKASAPLVGWLKSKGVKTMKALD